MAESAAPARNIDDHLLPAGLAQDTVESLYAGHGPQRPWTYWVILAGVLGALGCLPLIKVDVSVRASGLVRPATERTELRPAVSGQIAEVFVRENDRVHAGQPLLVFRSRDLEERLARNRAQQAERSALIEDLVLLTANEHEGTQTRGKPAADNADTADKKGQDGISSSVPSALSAGNFETAALRADYAQFRAQLDSYRLAETKARNELARYTTLAAKGIATQQELDNARYEAERLQAESKLLGEQALARWQARLRDERTTLADLVSEEQRLVEEQTHYTLRAPTDGVLVGFMGWSPGGFVGAGQTLGAVSPDDTLVVETYVSPKDIGLVRVGQTARLQIDAYPYTQWGTLDGTVATISGDFLTANSSANIFKVVVRPAANFLNLSNGTRGELKKGLTLSARFLVARRSIWQLLYEDMSNWLNPNDGRPSSP